MGRFNRPVTPGPNQIHDRLSLAEIESPVEESTPGKLSGLGATETPVHQILEHSLDHEGTAVTTDLERVLS